MNDIVVGGSEQISHFHLEVELVLVLVEKSGIQAYKFIEEGLIG